MHVSAKQRRSRPGCRPWTKAVSHLPFYASKVASSGPYRPITTRHDGVQVSIAIQVTKRDAFATIGGVRIAVAEVTVAVNKDGDLDAFVPAEGRSLVWMNRASLTREASVRWRRPIAPPYGGPWRGVCRRD